MGWLTRRRRIRNSVSHTFALHQAVRRGDLAEIRRIIAAGQDVNARDYFGDTALHIACKRGQVDAAKLLLELGAADRPRKQSPAELFQLAKTNDPMIGLQSEFTVNLQDGDGDTALHLAHYAGDKAAVQRLLDLGADPRLRNRRGLTPERMTEVRSARTNLLRLAALFRHGAPWGMVQLDPSGQIRPLNVQPGQNWTDPALARELHTKLDILDPAVFAHALVIATRAEKGRQEVLLTVIRIGKPGSLDALAEILAEHNSREIAGHYLNSGSAGLAAVGRRWATLHGLRVEYLSRRGGPEATWGGF